MNKINTMNKIFLHAVVALVAMSNLCSVASSDENRQPNIVFILADDLGCGDVQFHETDVIRGRSTDGPESKNDVDSINLWKSGKE